MSRRRSFVPGQLTESSLETRVVLSTFGDIGNWFSSQYNHVKQDLGITHKAKSHPVSTKTISPILQMIGHPGNPAPASSFLHVAHPKVVHPARMK